jgi:hypothetical protein
MSTDSGKPLLLVQGSVCRIYPIPIRRVRWNSHTMVIVRPGCRSVYMTVLERRVICRLRRNEPEKRMACKGST